MAVQQFRGEGVHRLEFLRQPYISLPYAIDMAEWDPRRARSQLWPHLWLYVANGLKLEGFYTEAERLYRKIARRHPAAADVALTNLADLYLAQAQWATEFHAYYRDNIALNPVGELPLRPRTETWHRRTLAEAKAVLAEALKANPRNRDALWLLTNAHETEGLWGDSLLSAGRYAAVAGASAETMFHRARAVFTFDPEQGGRLYAAATGDHWRTTVRRLATREDFAEDVRLVRQRLCEPARQIQIRTHVVTRGESFDIDHPVAFEPRWLTEYIDVEILPRFGMLLVADRWLLTDTTHVRRPHWPVFTTGLVALTDEHALLCTTPPREAPCREAIYIGNNNNYFHWMVEELPRLEAVLDDPAYARTPILVPHDAAPWQLELLKRVGAPPERTVFADFSTPLRLGRVVNPPRLARDLVVHPQAVAFLRDRLVPGHAGLKPRRGKKLYLLRGDAYGRAMLNEPEIVELFRSAGYTTVDPGKLSIDQQIELFSDAEVIAGPGGAALTNIIFAPKGAKIVALASDDVLTETFSSIAAAIGQEYWLCVGPSFPRAHRYWIWTRYNFILDPKDAQACIDSVEAAVKASRQAAFQQLS